MSEWFYSVGGPRQGPVTSRQLRQLAAEGTLRPTDKVWKGGMTAWVTAGKVHGLFPAIPRQDAETYSANSPHELPNAGSDQSAGSDANHPLLEVQSRAKTPTVTSPKWLVRGLLFGGLTFVGVMIAVGGVILWKRSTDRTNVAYADERVAERPGSDRRDTRQNGGDSLSADELAEAFGADRPAAVERYENKTLQVSGVVRRAVQHTIVDKTGKPRKQTNYVLGQNLGLQVWCFRDVEDERANSLVGKRVVLKGTCGGIGDPPIGASDKRSHVWLKGCEIVSVENGKSTKEEPGVDPYDEGVRYGESIGQTYAGRLATMPAAGQKEFRSVYLKQLRSHEQNYEEARNVYGDNNPNVRRMLGFCVGLRMALAEAGVR